MKKSHFVAVVLGTMGTLGFGIGMCMVLVVEWDLFQPGIIVGVVGLCTLLLTLITYRKMEGKAPIKFTSKQVMSLLLLGGGLCAFAVGMCLTMVYAQFMLGIVVGVFGILMMLCVIPLYKGLA